MTVFYLLWILYPAFYVWFVRFWFRNDYEIKPWIVYIVSIFFCVPACVAVLVYGTVLRVLDWASTNG